MVTCTGLLTLCYCCCARSEFMQVGDGGRAITCEAGEVEVQQNQHRQREEGPPDPHRHFVCRYFFSATLGSCLTPYSSVEFRQNWRPLFQNSGWPWSKWPIRNPRRWRWRRRWSFCCTAWSLHGLAHVIQCPFLTNVSQTNSFLPPVNVMSELRRHVTTCIALADPNAVASLRQGMPPGLGNAAESQREKERMGGQLISNLGQSTSSEKSPFY